MAPKTFPDLLLLNQNTTHFTSTKEINKLLPRHGHVQTSSHFIRNGSSKTYVRTLLISNIELTVIVASLPRFVTSGLGLGRRKSRREMFEESTLDYSWRQSLAAHHQPLALLLTVSDLKAQWWIVLSILTLPSAEMSRTMSSQSVQERGKMSPTIFRFTPASTDFDTSYRYHFGSDYPRDWRQAFHVLRSQQSRRTNSLVSRSPNCQLVS